MNLTELKEILNSDMPDPVKKQAIIISLAKDKNIIPDLLQILNSERETNKELIGDMNLELSRATTYIDQIKFIDTKKEEKKSFSKTFVMNRVEKFYTKHKGIVGHCFNMFPDKETETNINKTL